LKIIKGGISLSDLRFISFFIWCLVGINPVSSWAQSASPTYPNKPVTIVVTYAPGGLGDILARKLAENLTLKTKQAFIVENKPGATGALGVKYVAKAKPDGYTLLLGQTGEMVINPLVSKNLGYDVKQNFSPIAFIGEVPLIMVAPGNSPYNNLVEFMRAAKAKPGTLTYASSGAATPGHLAAASMAQAAGIDVAHVPYKGAGQAMTDLIGGHVDAFFSSSPSVMQQIQGRTLKALAVSSNKRMTVLPQVRSVSEDLNRDFNFTLWGGLLAPQGTPEAIINQLNSLVNTIIVQSGFKSGLEENGLTTRQYSPAEFANFLGQEDLKYSKILKSLNIQSTN
jgi:tripartite-type tricarboxylate transporter receptor subunit TctC